MINGSSQQEDRNENYKNAGLLPTNKENLEFLLDDKNNFSTEDSTNLSSEKDNDEAVALAEVEAETEVNQKSFKDLSATQTNSDGLNSFEVKLNEFSRRPSGPSGPSGGR